MEMEKGSARKYWVFQAGQMIGPYLPEQLARMEGFSSDTLVSDDAALVAGAPDWKRATSFPELALPVLEALASRAGAARWRGALPAEPTLRDVALIDSLEDKMSLLADALVGLRKHVSRQGGDLLGLKAELAERALQLDETRKRLALAGERLLALDELKLETGTLREELAAERRRVDALGAAEERLQRRLESLESALKGLTGGLADFQTKTLASIDGSVGAVRGVVEGFLPGLREELLRAVAEHVEKRVADVPPPARPPGKEEGPAGAEPAPSDPEAD